jgi:hypothetical protein
MPNYFALALWVALVEAILMGGLVYWLWDLAKKLGANVYLHPIMFIVGCLGLWAGTGVWSAYAPLFHPAAISTGDAWWCSVLILVGAGLGDMAAYAAHWRQDVRRAARFTRLNPEAGDAR